MNYLWHYNKLIETRKHRVLLQGEYYEQHHVIMKSMGGSNDKENLIYLTAREHFLAHWLLWRIHRNRQTALAFNLMCRWIHSNFIPSSRAYEESRISISEIGHSKETKEKISNKNKGNKYQLGLKRSDELKHNQSIAKIGEKNPMFGKTMSDVTREKISLSKKGKKRKSFTIETRINMGIATKLRYEKLRQLKLDFDIEIKTS